MALNVKKLARRIITSNPSGHKHLSFLGALKMLIGSLKAGFQEGVRQKERGEKLTLDGEKLSDTAVNKVVDEINKQGRKDM